MRYHLARLRCWAYYRRGADFWAGLRTGWFRDDHFDVYPEDDS